MKLNSSFTAGTICSATLLPAAVFGQSKIGEKVSNQLLNERLGLTKKQQNAGLRGARENNDDHDMYLNFKADHFIAMNASLVLNKLDMDSNTMSINGTDISLDGIEPMQLYAHDAEYIVDGKALPLFGADESPTTFTSKRGSDTIFVAKDGKSGDILSLDIFVEDGSDVRFVAATPGVFVAMTPDIMDQQRLSEAESNTEADFIYPDGDEAPILPGGRLLSDDISVPEADENSRLLQSGCTTFRVMEVALAFDSTFCAQQGGASQAKQSIERMVGRASLMYQSQGLRAELVISYLEGFCSASGDPYRSGIDLNNIGCDKGRRGVLQAFRDYWNNNKQSVRRDTAQLFFAKDFDETSSVVVMRTCCAVEAPCRTVRSEHHLPTSREAQQHWLTKLGITPVCALRCTSGFRPHFLYVSGLDHQSNDKDNKYIMGLLSKGTHVWHPTSLSILKRVLPANTSNTNTRSTSNLLINGSFESNPVAANTYKQVVVDDVAGWKPYGSTKKMEIWGKGFLGVQATDGNNVVELDAQAGVVDGYYQDIPTVANQQYILKFDMRARDTSRFDSNAETVVIEWCGVKPNSKGYRAKGWETKTVILQGTGRPCRLLIREAWAGSDGSGALVDNVRLTAANLLVNGSFESNPVAANTYKQIDVDDVAGWKPYGSTKELEIWGKGFLGVQPTDGDNVVELDAHAAGVVEGYYQDIPTVANQQYILEFDMRARDTSRFDSNGETVVIEWCGVKPKRVTEPKVGKQRPSA